MAKSLLFMTNARPICIEISLCVKKNIYAINIGDFKFEVFLIL